jgi:hypothetical protein
MTLLHLQQRPMFRPGVRSASTSSCIAMMMVGAVLVGTHTPVSSQLTSHSFRAAPVS